MEAKEGILLDRDGKPVLKPERRRHRAWSDSAGASSLFGAGHGGRAFVFQAPRGPLALLLVPVAFAVVLLFALIGLAVLLPALAILQIARLASSLQRRG